jgi:hypothetical protein
MLLYKGPFTELLDVTETWTQFTSTDGRQCVADFVECFSTALGRDLLRVHIHWLLFTLPLYSVPSVKSLSRLMRRVGRVQITESQQEWLKCLRASARIILFKDTNDAFIYLFIFFTF